MQPRECIVELDGFGDPSGSVDAREQRIAARRAQVCYRIDRHCALNDQWSFHA
jgi:hypothetical protein